MPDQHDASTEHALIQEIAEPLAQLPDDPVSIAADVDFPVVAFRGYDRIAVDAYVRQTSQLVAELHATRSPEAAVRRALEQVGEQISGILQRAHDSAEQITTNSRAEAEERLERARVEAHAVALEAERRVSELDAETDAIWAERRRIVDDVNALARQLTELAQSAIERFPAAETSEQPSVGDTAADDAAAGVDAVTAEDPDTIALPDLDAPSSGTDRAEGPPTHPFDLEAAAEAAAEDAAREHDASTVRRPDHG